MIYKRNVIKGLPGQKHCNICWQLESFFLPNLTGSILPLSAQVLTNHCTARKHTDVACPVHLQSGIDLFNSLWLCSPHRSWGKRRQAHFTTKGKHRYATEWCWIHHFRRPHFLKIPNTDLQAFSPSSHSGLWYTHALDGFRAEYSNICANSYNVPRKHTA